jgi:predicted AAA+ superfamily ATPase
MDLSAEYYVTESGVEVDFVIAGKDKSERQLIQVCWEMSDPATQKREVSALLSAMNELGISRSTIVTWLDENYSDRRTGIIPSRKWL